MQNAKDGSKPRFETRPAGMKTLKNVGEETCVMGGKKMTRK